LDLIGLIPSFGNLALTIAAFVVALSIIVAVHEYGHYLVARWAGIRSEVFSIGFGPVLWSRTDRRGTRWQVAALPFGGYVKFLGDADAASARGDAEVLARLPEEARRQTIHGAPLWARAATVAAGPLFNFALSLVIFAAVFLWQGRAVEPPTVGRLAALPEALPGAWEGLRPGDVILAVEDRPTPDFAALYAAMDALPPAPAVTFTIRRDGRELRITGPWPFPPLAQSVAPGSPASDAGLRAGDVVLSVDGRPITAFRELQEIVTASDGRPLALEVWRDGRTLALELRPRRMDLPRADGGFETRWMIGLTGALAFEPATATPGPLAALGMAADQIWFLIRASVSGLWHMVTGAISSCNLQGPIGIAETSGDMARQGLASFIWFVAVLSTAVGLLNLFPIPILDGGHLVFHAWEATTGRPPPERAMRVLMGAGLALILTLMAFALMNDLFCP
jgi:regulator of sigma E protease